MIDWSCLDCDWWDSVDLTADPPHYCPECGGVTEPRTSPESLDDKETLTDQL